MLVCSHAPLCSVDLAAYPYHVINRAVMRLKIFDTDTEFELFENLVLITGEENGALITASATFGPLKKKSKTLNALFLP